MLRLFESRYEKIKAGQEEAFLRKTKDNRESESMTNSILTKISIDKTEFAGPLDFNKIAKGARYNVRISICNTLAALMREKGRELAKKILPFTENFDEAQFDSMYNHALNRNEISWFGVKLLQKAGVIFSLTDEQELKLKSYIVEDVTKILKGGLITNEIKLETHLLKLRKDEYLGNINETLCRYLNNSQINYIFAPPGTGKTEWVKMMSKKHPVIILMPFISTIKNKAKDFAIEDMVDEDEDEPTLEKIQAKYPDCDIIYGTKPLELTGKRSVIMTFDKFAHIKKRDIEKISYLYKYLVIDESHLLFLSGYRIKAMGNVIEKIGAFFEESCSDSRRIKIVLMTGTSIFEDHFFTNLNHIQVEKETTRKKSINISVCFNTIHAQLGAAKAAADAIKNGKKVIIPTNQGDSNCHFWVGMIGYILGYDPNFGIFKRVNQDRDLNISVIKKSSISNFDLIFATNYLSVGIDINDSSDFVFIYCGAKFIPQEIEQFNNRIRKSNIECKLFFDCTTGGKIKTNLYNSKISLDLEEELQSEYYSRLYADNDSINSFRMRVSGCNKEEIITGDINTIGQKSDYEYFFVNHDHEYSLDIMEKQLRMTLKAPYFYANILINYGYDVTFSPPIFKDLTENDKAILDSGKSSAAMYIFTREQLIIYLIKDVAEKRQMASPAGTNIGSIRTVIKTLYDNLKKSGTVEVNMSSILVEDLHISSFFEVVFDDENKPQKVFVKDKEIYEKYMEKAVVLSRFYTWETIEKFLPKMKDSETGKLSIALLNRYVHLIRIIIADKNDHIVEADAGVLKSIYKALDELNTLGKWLSGEQHKSFLAELVKRYCEAIEVAGKSQHYKKSIEARINRILNTIADYKRKKGFVMLTLSYIPSPDYRDWDKTNQTQHWLFSKTGTPQIESELGTVLKHTMPIDQLLVAKTDIPFNEMTTGEKIEWFLDATDEELKQYAENNSRINDIINFEGAKGLF